MTPRLAWMLLAAAAVVAVVALVVAVRRDRSRPSADTAATAGADAAEERGALVEVELFFPGPGGKLVRERRELEGSADASRLASRIVEALLEGPRAEPAYRPFPGDVTIGEVHVAADGTAYVDLRSESSATPPITGSTTELLALYSLVNSVVVNVPGAQSLVVLWNGRQPRTLGGHVDTSRPLLPLPELAAA
jgi:hypothetical protein